MVSAPQICIRSGRLFLLLFLITGVTAGLGYADWPPTVPIPEICSTGGACSDCHGPFHPYSQGWGETECRTCHGSSLADRHHLSSMGRRGQCLACHCTESSELLLTRDCAVCHVQGGLPCAQNYARPSNPEGDGYRPHRIIMDYVPQGLGVFDKPYAAFVEEDCRACHGDQQENGDRHHALDPATQGQCGLCHEQDPNTNEPVRDCQMCHTGDDTVYPWFYALWGNLGDSHHDDTNLSDSDACTRCHDTTLVGELTPINYFWEYPPTIVTPTPFSCESCHFWDDPVNPSIHGPGASADGMFYFDQQPLHPSKTAMGFDMNNLPSPGTHMTFYGGGGYPQCWKCHSDDPTNPNWDPLEPELVRYCEVCHSIGTLHAIPGHVQTGSQYTVNGQPDQTVTAADKCLGCHDLRNLAISCVPLPGDTIYDTTGADQAFCIEHTQDRGLISAGDASPGSFGATRDAILVKLSWHGSIEWAKRLGSATDQTLCSIHQTSDGGYIGAGTMKPSVGGDTDAWVVKLDSSGTVMWQKRYGAGGNETAKEMQITPDGDFVLVGDVETDNGNKIDTWVLRLDSSGTILWQKQYGGTGDDVAQSIQCVDDGFIVGALTTSFVSPDPAPWVLKLAADGTADWARMYLGGASSRTCEVIKGYDGYLLVTSTELFGAGGSDVWVLKLSSEGFVEWDKAYGGSYDDIPHVVRKGHYSRYVIVGETWSFATRGKGKDSDIWVLSINNEGTIVKQRTYGGAAPDAGLDFVSFTQSYDAACAIAGRTSSFGNGSDDFWVLSLDDQTELPNAWFMGLSDAVVTPFSSMHYTTSSTAVSPLMAATDVLGTAEDGSGMIKEAKFAPYIESIKGPSREPGTKIAIKGQNFGPSQGSSTLHIGNKTLDATSPRIKLWSDTKIKVKLPKYQCEWFKGKERRGRKIWVTVEGVDSNVSKIKVARPATCP